jgi:serine/threonine protein kinase
MQEIKLHKLLSKAEHPYIVGFEHFFEDKDNVYILLEYCENNSMMELLKNRETLHELEV